MNDRNTLDAESAQLAAELALGLLDGDALREALHRQVGNAAFAAEVARWQGLTDRWLAQGGREEPSPDVLDRIERELDAGTENATATPRAFWKKLALAGLAASVFLAVALALSLAGTARHPERTTAPTFAGNVTQISDASGAPLLTAVYQQSAGQLSLRVAPLAKSSKVPELWVIPSDGKPRSLGLIGADRIVVQVSPELRSLLVENAALAITLEPPTGAPHAAPTGQIIGTAKLQAI